jgi:hypothetical protein
VGDPVPSVLAIPTALDVLSQQLVADNEAANIAVPLRALQLRGLSKLDLVVHIERLRARGPRSQDSADLFDENCLLALDIVHGTVPHLGLEWNASSEAETLYPRCLRYEDIEQSMGYAVASSDLLPPRPDPLPDRVQRALGVSVYTGMLAYELPPSRCDVFRVPKLAFTSRPGSLPSISDRILLEALVGTVEERLADRLPDEVIWPRYRKQPPVTAPIAVQVLSWPTAFVVKADISRFYESIEHSLLAVFLTSYLDLPIQHARAIETHLTAICGLSRGLPQGPLGSDVLASAYLLPVDEHLAAKPFPYLRYADDFYFPADSMQEARAILQDFEVTIADLGLSLNSTKTMAMRRQTFEAGTKRPSSAVTDLKETLVQNEIEYLHEAEDRDALQELLEEIGVDEQVLWDLLYHQTTTLDEVIEEIRDQLGPTLASTYSRYFSTLSERLQHGDTRDLASVQSLARECLAFLSASSEDVDPDHLDVVQSWFPELTPFIVRYLSSRPEPTTWVASYLRSRLATRTGDDWVDAWMCHAASRFAHQPAMQQSLRAILVATEEAPLTKLEVLRGLASAGALHEDEWEVQINRMTVAVRSEAILASLSRVDQYPWLRDRLSARDEPAFRIAAAEIDQQ